MEKFLSVLTLIGFVVMVFSIWSFLSVRKHIRQPKNNPTNPNNLSDQKYFGLKSRQDFIIASATIIFALITFLGYSTIDNIKVELDSQFESQKDSINRLNYLAIEQFKIQKDSINLINSILNENYKELQKIGTTYQDSVRATLKVVSLLREIINEISTKDIINQNIFIVDPLWVTGFSKKIDGKYKGFRFIKFSALTTILGKRLPVFRIPPSIICFSNNPENFSIGEINVDGFYIKTMSTDNSTEEKYNLWISQKSLGIHYPPIANAGEDQIIQLPQSHYQLQKK